MALKLATGVPQGIVADYWRIMGVQIFVDLAVTEVTFGLFVSHETRNAQPISIVTKKIPFNINILDGIYTEVKRLPEMSGSEDV